MMLISIAYPTLVRIFYEKIFEIVKFDLFEDLFRFDWILAKVFGFDDQPVSQRIADLGYESRYIITNLGSIFVFLVIYLVTQLIMIMIVKCGKSCLGEKSRIMGFARN